MRISLIKYAKEIIEKSHTLQGKLELERIEKIRNQSKTEDKKVIVTFYEFIAVLDTKRIKVIIKQINNGNLYFWSIIPFWKKAKDGRKVDSINLSEI